MVFVPIATIEALKSLPPQASLAIANYFRFAELREQVDSLNSGLQRQQRLISLTQNDLPILLRKDLDQTIAILSSQRGQRVRAGLAITESVSRQLDASSALQALRRETLTQLGMSVAMVAESTNEGPPGPCAGKSAAPPARRHCSDSGSAAGVLQSGEAILISNLDEDLVARDAAFIRAARQVADLSADPYR